MTDELLVLRCQLGERAAFTELVRAWHVRVWRYARRMLDAQSADDVTQEVWLAGIRGLPKLIAGWLALVASVTTTAVTLSVVAARGTGLALAAACATGAAMITAATVLIVRAHRRRTTLLRRKRELVERRHAG
ncbi:RNA polymerase sigma factor [Actinomadura alba]|uniref:RNA polymerase sigma-70 region 2 domain-containing protein n=1 Tax=Actinomadura alba TaxID=406431 RepID=A0ABR7LQ44_9ACTN|nr:sigma factor [Actinomadura alba]MBC6466513.1 hypothetical protein [Actinomadura alba]